MSQPLISIIVPVYKAEPYLERCVNSIRNQTYTNLEIILVDDGSPDRCGEMCDLYAAQDDRIRVIHKKNGGLSDARNAGLNVISGEYVGFVDSDDWIKPNMYEILYHQMIQEQAQISCCNMARCKDGVVQSYFNPNLNETFTYNTVDALCELMYNFRITNSVCDKLYLASIFQNLRMRTGVLYEDSQIQPYCIEKASRVCYTSQPLYCYFMSAESILRGDFSLRHYDSIVACVERIDYFANQYPEVVPYARAAYITQCMNLIYQSRNGAEWKEKRKELIRIVRQPLDKTVESKMKCLERVKRKLICIHEKLFVLAMDLRRTTRRAEGTKT